MQFIYRRCGSAPTHLMRCCILASGLVRCNDVLCIFYFFIFNGLAMRSGPKGIAYRCCCTLAFLFFGSAKAYSLASFGLCGCFERLANVYSCKALALFYSSLLSSSSIASLNQSNILDITNFPNPASVSILAKKLILASPFSIKAFSILSFSFIRFTSSMFFA